MRSVARQFCPVLPDQISKYACLKYSQNVHVWKLKTGNRRKLSECTEIPE